MASEILQQLESLKNEKTKIEHKISLLEAQLKDINLQNDAASSYLTNGLAPHMIHRYSRHLVLPSFGVQGIHSYHMQITISTIKGNFLFYSKFA